MTAVGLALSTLGPYWPLYIGHGVFIGLIGIGGINAPCYVYVSRWFDRRRGSALALISSGAYLAGAIWPPVFARLIAYAGWRQTMLYYAAFELILIVPAAALVLSAPPDTPHHSSLMHAPARQDVGHGLAAEFCFRAANVRDLHLLHADVDAAGASRRAVHGPRHQRRQPAPRWCRSCSASAFLSRQVWGVISDRIGGLYTMLIGSGCQAFGMLAFLLTQRRDRPVHRGGVVRSWLQRSCSGQYPRLTRTVPGRRSLLAHADAIVVQRLRHGGGRLDRRRAFTTISVFTRRPSPPDWASIFSISIVIATLSARKHQTALA